jgi:topoisomerase-4 subunit B
VTNPRAAWVNTTHDWAGTVDQKHLEQIRSNPDRYTPGGLLHLVQEVIAYPEDEAESAGHRGTCTVTLHTDGSIAIEDDGRGTDTRVDEHGQLIRKPIMATQDLRFFANSATPLLPDNHPRRGMSVVAALSDWLIHTNRRLNGSWTQRYEDGLPVTDLEPIESTPATGTTVHFHPNPAYFPGSNLTADDLRAVLTFPNLDIRIISS